MKNNKKLRIRTISRLRSLLVKKEFDEKMKFLSDHRDSLYRLMKYKKYVNEKGFIMIDKK